MTQQGVPMPDRPSALYRYSSYDAETSGKSTGHDSIYGEVEFWTGPRDDPRSVLVSIVRASPPRTDNTYFAEVQTPWRDTYAFFEGDTKIIWEVIVTVWRWYIAGVVPPRLKNGSRSHKASCICAKCRVLTGQVHKAAQAAGVQAL